MVAVDIQLSGTANRTHSACLCSQYSAGHCLTEHDVSHGSWDWVAACMLWLSKDRRSHLVRHLAFLDETGDVERVFMPRLTEAHAVQWVATLARSVRISVTGWVYL
jgi:hypothetical protein